MEGGDGLFIVVQPLLLIGVVAEEGALDQSSTLIEGEGRLGVTISKVEVGETAGRGEEGVEGAEGDERRMRREVEANVKKARVGTR